jgi:hypothetical protein
MVTSSIVQLRNYADVAMMLMHLSIKFQQQLDQICTSFQQTMASLESSLTTIQSKMECV